MKKITLFFLFIYSLNSITAQVGTLTGTGMSVCNLYSFSVCPNQTITPLNYGSQGYACTGVTMPDISFNIMGGGWRVMKLNWFFSSTVNGVLSGFNSSGVLQTIPFLATNTITPLSYTGTFVQFAINGVAVGVPLNQTTFSISLTPVIFGSNSYTYCANTATSIAISPTVPTQGGPWAYNWLPGNLIGNPINVSPLSNTIYTVTANSSAGCSSTATVAVNINCTAPPLCSGNLGSPVFLEDFGSGVALYGPALPPGVTNYIYQTGVPANGTYVISNNSDPSGSSAGYVVDHDHTGNINGYMMVVNSDYPVSEVYRKHVTGLCQNTTYVFSSYLSNNNTPSTPTTVCPGYVYANVKFQIEYPLSVIQNSIATGNLPLGLSNTALNWNQFGFAFTTFPGQTSVDVVLINNAPGGCGNDYVVDDISLSPCGPGVSLSISPNNSVFCLGDSLTLQSTFTSGGYVLPQYQWQFSNNGGITWTNIVGATSQNYSISSVTSTQAGSYQLLVAENGNINSSSCRIEAGPLTFSVSNGISVTSSVNVCPGSNATLTATGATSYTWSTGANTNSIIVNPSTTTSYTVTGAIGTCSNSAVSTVSVIPSPTITLTPALSLICSGQTASLTASGANTFTWTPSTTLSSNTGSMVTSTPITTTIYTVTGTANTCTNSAITTVSVLPSPTITLSPNASICQGSGTSATLTANGATSYTWNSASNLSSSTGSIVTANPNSTETYTVTGTLNSCTNTAITTVSVITTPTLSINSTSTIICPLGSSSLTATGATNYTWSPLSTLSSSSGSLVIASPNTTTTYTLLGSNGTCTNIAQAQSIITVTNNPIITSSNATICSSTSANLSASGGITYTWSPTTNLNASTGSTIISTPTAFIIYTVSGSSTLGCIGSSSVSVTVIPTPTLTISSNSLNLCIVGQSSALTANGASSYTWSPTTTVNSINTNTTIATPVNTTIYTVIGSNGFTPNICTSTQTIQINVGASAIPTVSPNDEICFGQSTTIYAIGGNTYHWSPTTGVVKPNDSTTLVKPNVTTIYTVTVSKNNICPVTATIQVIVDPLPIVNAGKDSTINIDQDIVLTGTGNVDVGFLSPDGNTLICNWCPIVTVHPLESTCYTLEGFNTYGCRNTDVVCITVTKEWDIFIPNAFTPNGDISNDYFIPKGYGIAQIDLSIFDRWGVCIFKETNTTLGWDGKYKGQLCQQGIYVYQVDVKAMSGENTTKTGHVTLLSKLK